MSNCDYTPRVNHTGGHGSKSSVFYSKWHQLFVSTVEKSPCSFLLVGLS